MPPTTVAAPPQFETRNPGLLLSGGRLGVALPVLNTGGSTAIALTVTSITLGSAARLEPVLPLVVGDLAAGNRILVNAGFAATGLSPGARLMLTVRGTYQFEGRTLGLSLNRVVTVPSPSPPPITFLAARLQATSDLAARTWSYVLVNEEPAGSPQFVNAVSLDMVRPFTVTGTPAGWAVDTDNLTYVLWYATDAAPPYPNHVAPGASLAGFQIQSEPGVTGSEGRAYTINSWNHSTDQADRVAFGTTLVPARS